MIRFESSTPFSASAARDCPGLKRAESFPQMRRKRIDGFVVMLSMILAIPRLAVYTMPATATPGRPASGSISRSDVRAQTATGAFGSPTLYVPATTGHDEPVELMSYGNAQSIYEPERYLKYTRCKKWGSQKIRNKCRGSHEGRNSARSE